MEYVIRLIQSHFTNRKFQSFIHSGHMEVGGGYGNDGSNQRERERERDRDAV
jgi:hypothetical protein